MPIDSLVFPIEHVLKEVYLSRGSGLPVGPYIRRCPKAVPSSILHNSQLPPPTTVSLSILDPGCGELPFAHHLNP
jgi:hypothetical protein